MYKRFTFVDNTISNLPEVMRAKSVESNGLFCFISICKFGSLKNPFAMITSMSELYFRIKIFPFGTNKKSDFYELWQQQKQRKTMEMNEA